MITLRGDHCIFKLFRHCKNNSLNSIILKNNKLFSVHKMFEKINIKITIYFRKYACELAQQLNKAEKWDHNDVVL